MTKKKAIVVYLEQVRVYGVPESVTRSEVLFSELGKRTVKPHNMVYEKADNKTMGEAFLNELIYVLGAADGEERQLPFNREILVYTSNERDAENYRTFVYGMSIGGSFPLHEFPSGREIPIHNFKLCQKLYELCKERGYHLTFFNDGLLCGSVRNAALTELNSLLKERNEGERGEQDASGK